MSNKIQQLLNTLKRPKRRPLPEFYLDDEEDLEIAANPKDPNAPKPEGMVMTPARGEQLVVSCRALLRHQRTFDMQSPVVGDTQLRQEAELFLTSFGYCLLQRNKTSFPCKRQ